MLETSRLTIFPLTLAQLQLYLRNDQSLEASLGLQAHKRNLPAILAAAIRKNILPAVATTQGAHFSTLWLLVDKHKKMIVGELHFKGPPGPGGELEIGYITYEEFRGQGYMSEAIDIFLAWAFAIPEVTSIVAETDRHNKASHRILEKAGFSICRESDWFYWWKLTKAVFACRS